MVTRNESHMVLTYGLLLLLTMVSRALLTSVSEQREISVFLIRSYVEYTAETADNLYTLVCLFVCLFVFGGKAPVDQGLLIHEVSRSHSTMHHSRQDSSSQRPLPDNTQHSQLSDIRAPREIRTHNLSRRVAAGLRLRPHGHWDRRTQWHQTEMPVTITIKLFFMVNVLAH